MRPLTPSDTPRSPARGVFTLASLLACGVLAGPSPAGAYVRSRADSCKAVYWAQTCIFIQADSGYVKDMTPAAIEADIDNAINAWQSQTSALSFIKLKHLPASGPLETTYKDGLQVIKFRADSWCRPAMDGNPQICYDPSATAITTVSYVNKATDPNDGEIIDADIELNAADNHFYDANPPAVAPMDGRTPADLWNTLTHEMGHMQGLDHTCRSASESATSCTVDNNGMPRPLCSDVANPNLRAGNVMFQTDYNDTMYAVAAPGETVKRMPKADDVQGITDSYPTSKDPKSCVQPGTSSGGCDTAGPGTVRRASAAMAQRPGLLLGLMGLVLLLPGLVRRRFRRSF